MRQPGLHNKLEMAWDRPFEVLNVPNLIHIILGVPSTRKKKRIGMEYKSTYTILLSLQMLRYIGL